MPNRLEQEFPPINWLPPVGPSGLPADVVWHYVEHGRQLRNRALRDAVRAVGTAVMRAGAPAITIASRVARCAGLLAQPGARRLTAAGP